MNSKLKVISAGFLLVGSFALTAPVAHADSLSSDNQKLQQLQSQQSQVQSQINAEQSKATTLKNAIASYDNALHTLDVKISTTNAQMSSLQAQQDVLNQQLAQNQKQLQQQQDELTQMVRTAYEDGSVSYLGVLFQANSFSDFLSRLYDLTLISNTQNQVVDSVRKLRKSIIQKQDQVKASQAKLQTVHDQLAELQQSDKTIQAQRQADLQNIQSNIEAGKEKQGTLESQIHLTQSQIQAIEAQTQAAEQKATQPSYVAQQTSDLVSASSNSIISFAQTFLGTPYVWGGTSPSGFDCSGFTQYVMAHAGVSIPRTSEAQFATGVPVSEGNLQPGDLVFFSTYAPGASHVGIYMGNGMMIDAEDMGVSIDSISNSYWGPKYIGARRYIK
ncbi:C40 family peptidase [Alicyclobacillus fastidiosus]|uniref:NlpC/P60 family protein n=1 Tax=Alicyclobacillus fastidiosus TaxID=392011 RepID=A0ABV5AE72_9BACL|nr:NlpC/P60 family protein [Alicyclobacillus fastidiosus]WEH09856.1 NlpC/P60 family protein [Alicyclobacillus fastidiosus]